MRADERDPRGTEAEGGFIAEDKGYPAEKCGAHRRAEKEKRKGEIIYGKL